MELLVWLNGELLPQCRAKISVYDHGFLYGDGIFETLRAYEGKVFRLEDHIERLYKSARALVLEMPWQPQELMDAINRTIEANGIKEGYIRISISRGEGPLGLDPKVCPRPTLVIMAKEIAPYPTEYREKGVRVVIVSVRRNHPEALSPQVKSMNFLNNIMAKVEASQRGAFEGIMLNQEGYLTEGTVSNIFLVQKGKLVTPPASAGVLLGTTRQVVIEAAQKLAIPFIEANLTRYDLYNAEEVLLTNSSLEVMPVTKVDERYISDGLPGPITQKLAAEYKNFIR